MHRRGLRDRVRKLRRRPERDGIKSLHQLNLLTSWAAAAVQWKAGSLNFRWLP